MRAYEVTRFGGPEVLELSERADPLAEAGDVIVDVRAAGLNPIDILQRSGTFRLANPPRFPFVPGNEFAGVVTAVGSKAESVAIGDAVIGRTDKARLGALAERVAIDASLVAPMPRSVDFTLAAAIPLAGTTALQGVRDALSVRPGDRLLITGGSGVVGMFAIQLAARVGARIVTTASAASESLLRRLGADKVVDYRSRPVDGSLGRFDKVFDLVGGAQTDALMTLVSAGGRLVSVASTPTPGSIRHDYVMSPLRAATLETALWVATSGKRRRARKGGFTYRFLSMRPSSEDLKELSALIDSGDMEIMLDSTYDFEHAADAFARVETRRAKGKVVVAVGGPA
jgi:alcohol dehydrogenase